MQIKKLFKLAYRVFKFQPIYIGSPDEMPQYLEIDGCGVLCDLEQFKALTSKYILDKDDYKTKCKSDDSCYIGYTYGELVCVYHYFWKPFNHLL